MKEVQKERVENRPLIGKLPIEGAYVVGALSGFGVMAACEQGNSWLPCRRQQTTPVCFCVRSGAVQGPRLSETLRHLG